MKHKYPAKIRPIPCTLKCSFILEGLYKLVKNGKRILFRGAFSFLKKKIAEAKQKSEQIG
jgi:hypothetical protein